MAGMFQVIENQLYAVEMGLSHGKQRRQASTIQAEDLAGISPFRQPSQPKSIGR